jgi:hypothetical protein
MALTVESLAKTSLAGWTALGRGGSPAAESRDCYVKADEEEQSGPKDVSREQKSNRGENACHGDDDADNNDHLRSITKRPA